MAVMKPIDVYNSLTNAEKAEIRKELLQDPCLIWGHRYSINYYITRWFGPPKVRLICSRCGKKRTV